MKQKTPGFKPYGDETRHRPGWGAILGLILAIAGLTLLLMVLIVVVLGSSWLPVYGAAVEPPPTLASPLDPVLPPAPTLIPVVLPTPLAEELFLSAAGVSPGDSAAAALLPGSPDGNGPPAGGALAVTGAGSAGLPARLEIPALGVSAPIQPVGLIELEENGQRYQQWQAPNGYAVGWHTTSARPGSTGNTVLNGHNNIFGGVFRDLVELKLGDEMTIYQSGQTFRYQVAHREVLEEKDQPLDVRLDNAKWMFPTADERLTLISCWPDIGATHRVIVVALAIEGD